MDYIRTLQTEIWETLALKNRQKRTMQGAKRAEFLEDKARQMRLNEAVADTRNLTQHVSQTRIANGLSPDRTI